MRGPAIMTGVILIDGGYVRASWKERNAPTSTNCNGVVTKRRRRTRNGGCDVKWLLLCPDFAGCRVCGRDGVVCGRDGVSLLTTRTLQSMGMCRSARGRRVHYQHDQSMARTCGRAPMGVGRRLADVSMGAPMCRLLPRTWCAVHS